MNTDKFRLHVLDCGGKRSATPLRSASAAQKIPLEQFDFVEQSRNMNPHWAEENLQTIRILMERSAVYRRALAPIMIFAGTLGLLASGIGFYFRLEAPRPFAALWLSTAGVAIAGTFLLARRQARVEHEPFWSPPTRRVAQALLPPLLSGLFISVVLTIVDADWQINLPTVLFWMLFYGCALHSAGFFMTRGIKWLGWIFIASAMGILAFLLWRNGSLRPAFAGLIMGFFFGVLHLAYGIYLYFTEPKTPVA